MQGFHAAEDALGSWNACSRRLLLNWHVKHPSELATDPTMSYAKYKTDVTKALKQRIARTQEESILESSAPLPHYLLQPKYPSGLLAECANADLDWATAIVVRSFVHSQE